MAPFVFLMTIYGMTIKRQQSSLIFLQILLAKYQIIKSRMVSVHINISAKQNR